MKVIKDDELRSVELFRWKGDKGKMELKERNYQSNEGSPHATIEVLTNALSDKYDLLILHDQKQGCYLIDLKEDAEKLITKLPCKLHK